MCTNRYAKGLAWSAVVACSLVLGACRGSTLPPQSSAAPTATPRASTAPSTPTQAAAARLVTVTVDAPRYARGATIVVTIHNGLAQPIFARDTHADCTVVQLERLQGGAWQSDPSCVDRQPAPHLDRIDAGDILTQTIPGLNDFTSASWPTGTYRAAVTFTIGPDQSFQQSTIAYSPSFLVG